ncbi:hypothetical protein DsansV1_C19g0159731 [Dioscorea sansibarensis]
MGVTNTHGRRSHFQRRKMQLWKDKRVPTEEKNTHMRQLKHKNTSIPNDTKLQVFHINKIVPYPMLSGLESKMHRHISSS